MTHPPVRYVDGPRAPESNNERRARERREALARQLAESPTREQVEHHRNAPEGDPAELVRLSGEHLAARVATGDLDPDDALRTLAADWAEALRRVRAITTTAAHQDPVVEVTARLSRGEITAGEATDLLRNPAPEQEEPRPTPTPADLTVQLRHRPALWPAFAASVIRDLAWRLRTGNISPAGVEEVAASSWSAIPNALWAVDRPGKAW